MELFTVVGNLITIFVVAGILVIYRLNDKRGKTLDAARSYGKQLEDKLKDELNSYIEKKKADIYDYGANLTGNMASARAMLANITGKDGELKKQAEVLGEVEKRLAAYDASLGELLKMTGRVETNLSRIQQESDFVENVAIQIDGAKETFMELSKNTGEIHERIESGVSESLAGAKMRIDAFFVEQQKKIETITNAEKAVVEKLIAEQRETIDKNFAEQQTRIDAAERERSAGVERDKNIINTMLKDAVNNAGELITEQKETIDKNFAEQQTRIDAAEQERSAAVERDKNIINTMLKDAVNNAGARAGKLEDEIYAEFRNQTEERAKILKQNVDEQIAALKDHLGDLELSAEKTNRLYDDIEQKSSQQIEKLAELEADFAEQRKKLEIEFQMQLDNTVGSVRKEISLFEDEASAAREKISAEYNSSLSKLKNEITEVEKTIEKIKQDTFEKTAENLKLFEDEFTATLEKRRKSVNSQFASWRDEINNKLDTITENQEAECKKLEINFTNNLSKHINKLDEEFQSELKRFTDSAGAFENNFTKQVEITEENINSLKEQMQNDFRELRESSLETLNTEIARNGIENFDKIKNFTREIENEHKMLKDMIETKNAEIAAVISKSQNSVEENEKKTTALKTSIDEMGTSLARHREELFSGVDENSKELRENIKRQEEKLQEFFIQAKIIEKNIEMKNDLNRQVEDLQNSLNKLEIQKTEIGAIERQLSALKKLESDVNLKIARFEGEQRRMELIEDDFNKLLETSISVKEKLSSLTENDDALQEMQLKMRKLSEIMAETDEKYQRIEKKNKILDETNDGIDDNFKKLQESEKTAGQFVTTITHLTKEIAELQNAVSNITNENTEIIKAADKVSSLDVLIHDIDGRMQKMQQARQWCADLEERLLVLNEQAHNHVKLAGTIIDKDTQKTTPDKAPNPNQRRDIIELKRKGWSVEEIARTLKIARSTVELTLEMAQDI
jgi:chromosome segregation ATPase